MKAFRREHIFLRNKRFLTQCPCRKNKHTISDVKHRFGMNDSDKSVAHVKPAFLCRQKSECADGGWVDDINY